MVDYHPTHRNPLDRFLFDWFQPETLGAVRFYFGLGLVLYLGSQYPQLLMLDWFGAPFHFTIPIWYFQALGITHNLPWLIPPVYLAMLTACLFFAFGKWTRPAIVAIVIAVFYLKGVRDSFSGDVHHREVPVFALLVLFFVSKCDRMFGIDARRKALPAIERWESSWPLRAMQVYVAMFYFWALMAKLRLSGLFWFQHGGHVQETLVVRALRDGFGADGQVVNLSTAWSLAHNPDLIFVFGAGVFAFELLIPLIVFVRDWRWRLLLLIGATVFHISNYVLMNVQFFLYPLVFVVFFDMARFHAWVKPRLTMQGKRRAAPVTS